MIKLISKHVITFILAMILISSTVFAEVIPREQLIMDIRQLAEILESSHPDPYFRGGGKIAFHKRLHELMNSIPAEGMMGKAFQKILLPFVAMVGDGHTRLHVNYEKNEKCPGGVPLFFDIVEESLYVSGVFNEDQRYLIGSLLVSVNDIPFRELCKRVERLIRQPGSCSSPQLPVLILFFLPL
jgi:hypothetical protein